MGLGSFLGKIGKAAVGFIPGVGPAASAVLGGIGGQGGGQGGQQATGEENPGFWGQYGPAIASTGLGVLGNVLQARAANQPEAWRQKLIEEELQRRNAYQQAGIPSLMGALGYRSPQAGQQLIGQLGKNR